MREWIIRNPVDSLCPHALPVHADGKHLTITKIALIKAHMSKAHTLTKFINDIAGLIFEIDADRIESCFTKATWMPELKALTGNAFIATESCRNSLLSLMAANDYFNICGTSAPHRAHTKVWHTINNITDKPHFIKNSLIPLRKPDGFPDSTGDSDGTPIPSKAACHLSKVVIRHVIGIGICTHLILSLQRFRKRCLKGHR